MKIPAGIVAAGILGGALLSAIHGATARMSGRCAGPILKMHFANAFLMQCNDDIHWMCKECLYIPWLCIALCWILFH